MNPSLHPELARITAALRERSTARRAAYLARIEKMKSASRARARLSASNLAHGYAALPSGDKIAIKAQPTPMLAIVSAYNDVLSAHEPLETYPAIIKDEARKRGAVAQYAGGVPAMCDGVTQGQPGMELSLFSRDVIAMATGVALTHDLYDGALMLGVCDKIVPGLLIGALSFGHLPTVFVPAGPMSSGLSNSEKARIRKEHAQGKVGPQALLDAEMAAYHGRGTCTFYGTANSNQLLLEAMGLMLPGMAFVHPDDPRRELLTRAATQRVAQLSMTGADSLAELVNEKSLINAIVALLATGGSTNHTMHWLAIARAAGYEMTWDDIDALSRAVPTLTRLYPNGEADVNRFNELGGTAFVFRELLAKGLMHGDIRTIAGGDMQAYTQCIAAEANVLRYEAAPAQSADDTVLRGASKPFFAEGGIRLVQGNLGRAIMKVSAVADKHRKISAPCRVFENQESVQAAFKAGAFTSDCVVVVRGQGPRACGMPELHKLTPALSVLLDQGLQVALVTDGRMSGASGKVPAAIHVTPEAAEGGLLAKLQDGDVVEVDCETGSLRVLLDDSTLAARPAAAIVEATEGFGRELFARFRQNVTRADQGASVIALD
ncbi:MAG: phosphogluconate dehydratase [Burkholderiaceae bacterium]